MKEAISVKNIKKVYGKNTVLNNINMDIEQGEFICLLGPSGCGKSTLLRLIAGLDKPTEGKIFLSGKDATGMPPSKRNFGIVFQSYALFPNLTAFENVAYGLKSRKYKTNVINEVVDRYFDMVGLSDKKDRYPFQMSGGEQQRVALARALALSPNFLLLDEPLSALDAKVRIKLRREICKIQRELKLTTIMVTHDQDEALTMADRIIVMNKAEVMQIGTPIEVYEHPKNKFVADFIGAINFYTDFEDEKSKVMKAIRPENIHISTQEAETGICSIINDIEFRGNFCRLTAQMSHILKEKEFIIDMPFGKVKDMELKVGDQVYLEFPEEDTFSFIS